MASLVILPYQKAVSNISGSGGQATISSETPNAGEQIIVNAFMVSCTNNVDPTTSVLWYLRDGPSTTGTIRLSGRIYADAKRTYHIALSGLFLPMTPGNVATVEFDTTGIAFTFQDVNLVYTRTGLIG